MTRCAYLKTQSPAGGNPQSAKTVNTAHSDNIVDIVNIDDDLPLPTFSPRLRGTLPAFLERVVSQSNSPEDADIFILGTMAVISACLPHVSGVYADFNETFSVWQTEYSDRCGDEFVASVRRLGLITFRIAMILSALRIMEDGNFTTELFCLDTDHRSAMTVAEVILRHNAQVFLTLPKAEAQQTTSAASSTRTTLLQRQFLEALPSEFDRQTYTEAATALGINARTADRIIRRRCDTGQIENIAHGKYRKKTPP